MGRFFVEKKFSEAAKLLGDQIVEDLRDEFEERFKKAEWMTDTVRQSAISKLNKISQKIGYPTKVCHMHLPSRKLYC
jgi:endothelin-converting enzyme